MSAVRPGYRQTEVGVIPEEWDVRPFYSAVTIPSGQVDPRVEPYCSMILIAPDHIESGTGRLLERATAKEQHAISGKYQVEPGDVVYSKIRPNLSKAVHVRFGGLCSADMYPLRAKPGVSAEYIHACIIDRRFVEYATSVSLRSGMPKINREELASFTFVLPRQLPEQQAIAEALGDADALIEALDALIAKKRAIKQAAMQDLLTGHRRLPGFQGEWGKTRLDALADIRSGGTPSTTRAEFWGGSIAWCTPTDITALSSRKYLSMTSDTISELGLKNSSAEIIPPNSVVMTSRATIGERAINLVPLATNQGFKNFVPLPNADTEFLYYILGTQKTDFIALCGGSTFLEIGKKQLREFMIHFPPTLDEQRAIAAVLSDMDAEIAALEDKLAKARVVKQGMMQVLLTGEIRLV